MRTPICQIKIKYKFYPGKKKEENLTVIEIMQNTLVRPSEN